MLSVKILGTGCKKCQTLEKRVRELVAQNNIDAAIEKVTEIQEIISYGIMTTPGLVVNGKVVSYGIVPKDEQIISWLNKG